uniref:Uncharacterized protein n=1 Tax=Zooxanthella nutricula TaxID=1333877 RepID=A0A7S2Q1R2_9DINO
MGPQVGSVHRVLVAWLFMLIFILEPVSVTWSVPLPPPASLFSAAILLWCCLLMFLPGSRKKNLLWVFFVLVFIGGFFILIQFYQPLLVNLPVFLQGFLATGIMVFMKLGMGFVSRACIQYLWVPGTNFTLVAWLATLSISLATIFKLGALAYAASQEGTPIVNILFICTTSLLCEVLDRNDFGRGFVYRQGWLEWRPTPVWNDLCKQAAFKANYYFIAPLLTTIFTLAARQPGLFDVQGSTDDMLSKPMFWVAIAMYVLTNALADLATLQIQKEPGEGLAAAFGRLHLCGEHKSIWRRPAGAVGKAQVQTPHAIVAEESVEVVLFGRRIPWDWVFHMGVMSLVAECWHASWKDMLGKSAADKIPITCCQAFM